MTDRTPEQIRDEAARILESETFKTAIARVKGDALRDLLAATGTDRDTVLREKADLIKAVDAVEAAIRAEMMNATAALRPRAQVA